MHYQPVSEPLAYYKPAPKPKPAPKFFSPLTGVEVPDEAATKRPVTAIMLENSPDARPQSGIKDAGIVYEAVAEGGITRFLAIYQEAQPGLVGPVRSLRPYFVEWAAPYQASIAHVGGSKKALDEVRNGTYRDIDQFFNARTYWRSSDRYAPHNVYTNFERLNALNQAKGYITSTFTGFERKADTPNKPPTATRITVPISSGIYNSSYIYEPSTNSYKRSQGNQPHNDREAGQISPKNVIVMRIPTSIGREDGWREQMNTTGSGDAFVFQDGVAHAAKWHKAGLREPLKILHPDGTALKLNPGQTWLTAVSISRTPAWQ